MSQSMAVPQGALRRRRRHTSVLEIGPGTDVGSYEVEARQGAGGYGTVFRARRGGQLYALKFLSLAAHAGWAEREAVVLTRVHHRNVARLCGYSQWPDAQPRYLVVVMEFVAGQRLDEWTQEHNPSARRVLELLRHLSQGLGAVHKAGVVHRDVKEANIIVRQQDGEPVLVDFGVSGHAQAARVTPGRLPPGTPEYRSPEAWRFGLEASGGAATRYRPRPADDIYALGVVLYWLLTEEVPFASHESVDVEAVLTQPPVPPHERNARVPPELSQLCLRLLAKEPGARPDAAGLGQAVEQLLTRPGAEWDEPLFEPYAEHNRTTEGGAQGDEAAQWARVPPRPRRGKPAALPAAPPVPQAPAAQALPLAATVLPEPPPVTAARPGPERSKRRMAASAGLMALGVLAVALGLRGHGPAQARAGVEPTFPTSQVGQKVAPPLKPPDVERAVLLPTEGVLAAPVAAGATAPQHEASVTTPQQPQPKRLGPVKKAAALLGACTTLACSGPTAEVRPPPVTAEPCPPGSLEAMEQLGIRIGAEADAMFTWHKGSVEPVKVSEGWTTVRLGDSLGGLLPPAVLSGRIILTEKWAYGHFVQATTKQGKTYPVCLSYRGPRNDEGEAKSTITLKAVREFK